MKLKDDMLLFHGSYTAVEKIDLSMCLQGKDFGSGFYLTSSVNQARSFIKTSAAKAKQFGDIRNNGTVYSELFVNNYRSATV